MAVFIWCQAWVAKQATPCRGNARECMSSIDAIGVRCFEAGAGADKLWEQALCWASVLEGMTELAGG
eukprot:NODE_60_length_2312_cov_565.042977.p16 GENE.NODE_60_length_2312_cov_565.042977~~NODE_60_length_2312_cov_565.042977.p16  ORF type:complete len:67 (+),score=3.61 NODE_60_length_2312_cov_565.042977:1152-1352(+)